MCSCVRDFLSIFSLTNPFAEKKLSAFEQEDLPVCTASKENSTAVHTVKLSKNCQKMKYNKENLLVCAGINDVENRHPHSRLSIACHATRKYSSQWSQIILASRSDFFVYRFDALLSFPNGSWIRNIAICNDAYHWHFSRHQDKWYGRVGWDKSGVSTDAWIYSAIRTGTWKTWVYRNRGHENDIGDQLHYVPPKDEKLRWSTAVAQTVGRHCVVVKCSLCYRLSQWTRRRRTATKNWFIVHSYQMKVGRSRRLPFLIFWRNILYNLHRIVMTFHSNKTQWILLLLYSNFVSQNFCIRTLMTKK